MSDEPVKPKLVLFITGHTQRSEAAIRNCRKVLDDVYGQYNLRVVDSLENPERAQLERVVATPVLIRYIPAPKLRLVGDMSDREAAVEFLRTGQMPISAVESAEDEMILRGSTSDLEPME